MFSHTPLSEICKYTKPPNLPQNTPFSWPELESGQNELQSGQPGPQQDKMFEKWTRIFYKWAKKKNSCIHIKTKGEGFVDTY